VQVGAAREARPANRSSQADPDDDTTTPTEEN
jgi:hypothetical protein